MTAYNLMLLNKDKVQKVADKVLEEKEVYGDDLVHFLDAKKFEKPQIDWTDENVWPKFMNYSRDERGDRDKDKDKKDKGEAEGGEGTAVDVEAGA